MAAWRGSMSTGFFYLYIDFELIQYSLNMPDQNLSAKELQRLWKDEFPPIIRHEIKTEILELISIIKALSERCNAIEKSQQKLDWVPVLSLILIYLIIIFFFILIHPDMQKVKRFMLTKFSNHSKTWFENRSTISRVLLSWKWPQQQHKAHYDWLYLQTPNCKCGRIYN